MINDLSNEMHQFIKDLENNISNPKELDYILKRTEKLFDVVFKTVENIMDFKESEMDKLEAKQDEQNKRIDEITLKMKELCSDIYDEDYGDFEIVCPYCNHEFDADIDETKDEIICPECNNIIELDWDEESE